MKINNSIKRGFSFGLTSGVITTLGLMVGLSSGTHSALVVVGGILVIAVADGLSDSLGIHISEESQNKYSSKEIWQSTIATFLSKLIFALSFIVPVVLLPLTLAIFISILWGLTLIAVFSYYMAKQQKSKKSSHVVIEHVVISIIVIIATHYIGAWVALFS